MSGRAVAEALDRRAPSTAKPGSLTVDHGTEFTSRVLDEWATAPGRAIMFGRVAIVARGEIVGGLGVAGSPGGDKDEACAQAGVAKIKSQLPQ
jgi:uncharacterized protein GlcG (DUF336 family)